MMPRHSFVAPARGGAERRGAGEPCDRVRPVNVAWRPSLRNQRPESTAPKARSSADTEPAACCSHAGHLDRLVVAADPRAELAAVGQPSYVDGSRRLRCRSWPRAARARSPRERGGLRRQAPDPLGEAAPDGLRVRRRRASRPATAVWSPGMPGSGAIAAALGRGVTRRPAAVRPPSERMTIPPSPAGARYPASAGNGSSATRRRTARETRLGERCPPRGLSTRQRVADDSDRGSRSCVGGRRETAAWSEKR